MTLTVPTKQPGILAVLYGPDSPQVLKRKLGNMYGLYAGTARERDELERQVARLTRERDTAEATVVNLAQAWSRTIRPTTAARRAEQWARRGTRAGRLVALVFASRAGE